MINHDEELIQRLLAKNTMANSMRQYAEHQAKQYEARIAELEQDKDSQAILAAAKELGRVEVLKQLDGCILSSQWEGRWVIELDGGCELCESNEDLLAYLDSRGEDV